jgi:hypothetical protein
MFLTSASSNKCTALIVVCRETRRKKTLRDLQNFDSFFARFYFQKQMVLMRNEQFVIQTGEE